MATEETKVQESIIAGLEIHKPKSLEISKGGIKTGADFANLMSSLMSDLIEGRLSPVVGNAVCNAGSKLLKIVEMQYKYGKPTDTGEKVLTLAQTESVN